jgi:hypothetical protein
VDLTCTSVIIVPTLIFTESIGLYGKLTSVAVYFRKVYIHDINCCAADVQNGV